MGRMNALGMAAEVDGGNVVLNSALHWHLTSNHYPPMPVELVSVAEEAIEKADEGEWEHEIEIPDGINFRGRYIVTVSEAVEVMHLDSFLSLDEDEEPV